MRFLDEWLVDRYIFIFVLSLGAGIFLNLNSETFEVYIVALLLLFIFKDKKIYIFIIIFAIFFGFFYSDYINEKIERKVSEFGSNNLTVLIEGVKKNNYTGKIINSEMKIFFNRKINFYYKGTLEVGDIYKGEFQLESFKLQRIPGGFNEKIYYFSNNIFYKGRGEKFHLISGSRNIYSNLLKGREKLKAEYTEKFTGKARGLLPALVFGDKSLFPEETKDSFQLLGISHLLAVSGLHGGIIAGFAYRIFTPGGFYIKNGAAWIFLFIYAFLAGFSPSINRAALMFFLFSLRKIYLRYPDPWTILSLSALPQILINPFVVLSIGFQLSYLTIAGIVLFHKNKKSKLSLSFAAVAGTLPIVIYYFHKISLIGIVINLFYVPLFAIITFWSMVGLFIPFTENLDKFANFTISGTEKLSEIFQFLDINISAPSFWEILLYYGVLVLVFRKKKVNLKVLLTFLVFLLITSFYPKDWELTFLDVGQGDATFISTKKGKTILIDGGPWGREVENYLSFQGINKPELFIISHGDADHINGILWLMETHPPKNILLPVNLETNDLIEKLIYLANKNKVNIIYGYAGYSFYIDNTKFEVISPLKAPKYSTSNNQSLVLLVSYKDKRIMLTGDIEKEVLDGLDIPGKINVLKAPHHGSSTGISERFFRRELFDITIISCGEKNRYGHPGKEFLNLIESRNIPYLRTDKVGTISFINKGEKEFYIKTTLD